MIKTLHPPPFRPYLCPSCQEQNMPQLVFTALLGKSCFFLVEKLYVCVLCISIVIHSNGLFHRHQQSGELRRQYHGCYPRIHSLAILLQIFSISNLIQIQLIYTSLVRFLAELTFNTNTKRKSVGETYAAKICGTAAFGMSIARRQSA